MPLDKPPTRAYTLGVLLGGGGFEEVLYQMEMSDCQSPAISTLTIHLPDNLRAVDEVYDEFMADHREAIKIVVGRRLVRIDPEKHYFVKHHSELNDMIARGFSVKIPLDGTYRNRNHTLHAINIICASRLMHNDFRGLRDTVIDHMTAGRHIGAGAPQEPICALSRNGGDCHVHGKVVDWSSRTKPGSAALPEDIKVAEKLHRGNCFLCTGVRGPLSAPATEPLGIHMLCLRLMFKGF